MSFKSFYELDVYKVNQKFRKSISQIIKKHFPKDERYLLTAQLKDASRSITANIAEGHGRFHYQENIQFCRVSRGSLSESLEHLITAFDDEYITSSTLEEMKTQYDICLKQLNTYIKYLKNKKKGGNNN